MIKSVKNRALKSKAGADSAETATGLGAKLSRRKPKSGPPKIVVVSNDVLPGMQSSVAAPGLRSHGIVMGLKAAGLEVDQVVVSGPVKERWRSKVPPAHQPGVEILNATDLGSYLSNRAPAIVVLTNSNQIDHIPQDPGIKIIVDLFAPRILEVCCQQEDYPTEELAVIRARNAKAFEMADSFIVNGEKKLGFYLAWLMQTERDPRKVPMDVVPMAAPKGFSDSTTKPVGEESKGIQAVTAGYLQGWSKPGPWFQSVANVVGEHQATFNVLAAPRGDSIGVVDAEQADMAKIFNHSSIRLHKEMQFKDFQKFMSGMDFAIDLFSKTIERQYAMVTRTVVAISCGIPVLHPPWTETAAYIADYDAGWLVDPDDAQALDAILKKILSDPEGLKIKAANAKRLWYEVFNPDVAMKPLVKQINALSERFG